MVQSRWKSLACTSGNAGASNEKPRAMISGSERLCCAKNRFQSYWLYHFLEDFQRRRRHSREHIEANTPAKAPRELLCTVESISFWKVIATAV